MYTKRPTIKAEHENPPHKRKKGDNISWLSNNDSILRKHKPTILSPVEAIMPTTTHVSPAFFLLWLCQTPFTEHIPSSTGCRIWRHIVTLAVVH